MNIDMNIDIIRRNLEINLNIYLDINSSKEELGKENLKKIELDTTKEV